MTVVTPIEDTPAYRAGLQSGDVILTINGQPTQELSLQDVVSRIRGPKGTEVELGILHSTSKSPKTIRVKREAIPLVSVKSKPLEDGYYWIRLTRFSGRTDEDLRDALKKATRECAKTGGLKGIVLDLRNNPGGLLDQAVSVSDMFLSKGTIVSIQGRGPVPERIYEAKDQAGDIDVPVVVIINAGSASASEIVAGALRDQKRALIIGERSFGKGLVQTTRPMPYNGMIKITTSKYYIPSGRSIQAIDYSHRNAAGRAERIPDSLTTAYTTAAGRIVRDGGGITPDVKVELEQIPNIVYYLVNDMYIFRYATRFAQQHDTIAPIEAFVIDDEIYNDFKAYVQSQNFTYDRRSQKVLDELRKWTEFEGYLTDITPEIDSLSKKLSHNLDHDFANFRDEIAEQLAFEIVKRYYYQKGEICESLKDDPIVTRAEEILLEPEQYRAILQPGKASDKKEKKS